ncbi:MAG: isocitrate/isopropylmalate family dehydrogenase [Candidatus Neomarinimicrobiota bacterium]
MKFVFIPGDGVGPEISTVLNDICQALENYTNIKFNIQTFELGLQHYQDTGILVPAGMLKECRQAAAIWVGPLTEKTAAGVRFKADLLQHLLSQLDLTVFWRRIKPVSTEARLVPDKIFDILVLQDCLNYNEQCQELSLNLSPDERVSLNFALTSHRQADKILDYAQKLIAAGDRHKLTIALPEQNLVKENPWVNRYKRLLDLGEFPVTIMSIDRLAFKLLHQPDELDVVVTCPPFGEILSKIGAAIEGSYGLAYEAFLNPDGLKLYQILHPTSDRFVGKDAANPIGAILALVDILRIVNREPLGRIVEKAVLQSLTAGWSTRDMGGSMGTSEIGNFICNKISELAQ